MASQATTKAAPSVATRRSARIASAGRLPHFQRISTHKRPAGRSIIRLERQVEAIMSFSAGMFDAGPGRSDQRPMRAHPVECAEIDPGEAARIVGVRRLAI